MEPNKLDTKIREKLNARELQPSAQAWDRLDAMLTVSEEKKPKKGYGWFFVAASTILFFGLGFFLFNSNETQEINEIHVPMVTNSREVIDSEGNINTEAISIKNEESVLVQNEVNYSKKSVKNKKSEEVNKLMKSENVLEEKITSNSQLPTPNSYKYVSAERLLAAVDNKSETKQEISIDRKVTPKSKTKVDANSLLTSVEGELNESFRESAFDRINRNYNVIKSALANRNYE